jgi:hypothetical protein
MSERIKRVLATVALKLDENDGTQYAGDIAASGKLAGFGLKNLVFCGLNRRQTITHILNYVKSDIITI